MTDKQNHFTYTDNTSDNNDKIMENLHKQTINITIDDLINGNLQDMEFTAQFGVYRQAVKSLAKQLKHKTQECEKAKQVVLQAVEDFSLEYGTPYYDKLLDGAKSLGIEVKDYE